MLSQSNIDKLVMTGLYGHEVPEPTELDHDPRWCKNWTFKVIEHNGRYWMQDTYWGSGDSLSFELTDDNIEDFTFIFDFASVTSVSRDSWREYREEDRYCEAVDSGGYTYSKCFVKKDARPSRELKREILLDEIKGAENSLEWKRQELARLEADGMGGFYE